MGVTWQTYWRRLADELGFWQATTVSTTASAGEAARILLADAFRDDEIGHEFLGRPWVYVGTGAQAGTQRRIVSQQDIGYQGEVGGLVVSRPYAAAVASGSVIEVTSPLPIKRHLGQKGVAECVNEALARIKVAARVSVTGNGTTAYELGTTIPNGAQIGEVYDTRWLGSNEQPEQSLYPPRIVTNGVDRTLVTDTVYSSSETFYLDVIVDADRLIYDGASWSFVSTPGLQGDAWMAAAPEAHVLAFGMAKALEQLMKLVSMRDGLDDKVRARAMADIEFRYAKWATAAADIQATQFPKPLLEPERPIAAVTAARRRWR